MKCAIPGKLRRVFTTGPTGLCWAKEADPGREMRGKKIRGQKKRKKQRKSASICAIAVFKIKRSLYGLKQAPWQWNLKLNQCLLKLGLRQSAHDPTLYFQLVNDQLIGAISVHVDDLSVVGEQAWVSSTIAAMGKHFTIGEDDDLHHFLSLKITCNLENRLVFLSQDHYIKEL
jgi:hypothetical protein